jgi:hypothetical protein
MRMAFEPAGTAKQTFAIGGHAVDLMAQLDLMAEEDSDAEAAQSSN